MQTITLFSGLALKDVFEGDLIGPFIEKTGATVRRVYEPTAVLRDMVRNGERPDVLVGVTSTLRDMAADGDVRGASIRVLVRSEVGAAASPKSSTGSVETIADFRDLMDRISSVAYSASGASGEVFQRVLAELHLTDVVAPKDLSAADYEALGVEKVGDVHLRSSPGPAIVRARGPIDPRRPVVRSRKADGRNSRRARSCSIQ